jgi:hypothetical protein
MFTLNYGSWKTAMLNAEIAHFEGMVARGLAQDMHLTEVAHMRAEVARREGKALSYKYTAKTPAVSTGFMRAGRVLASMGYKAVFKGRVLTTDAEPRILAHVVGMVA